MIGPGAARPGLLAYGYVRLLDHTRDSESEREPARAEQRTVRAPVGR
jgi:hypothetical protein